MTGTARRLCVLALCAPLLGGCLMTLGAPLMRRVEPGRWTVEAAAALTSQGPGFAAHAYIGRALGRHFEIGLMPYGYNLEDLGVGAVYVPIKWDPLAETSRFRWILHAGPAAFFGGVQGAAAVLGTGMCVEIGRRFEILASASTAIPAVQLFSLAGGFRVGLTERFSLGLTGFFSLPAVGGVELSGSAVLGR